MEISTDALRHSFKKSYHEFIESREEAQRVTDFYHNRQYTDAQRATLRARGQPAETYNVIKLFSRVMLGYFSTVVRAVKATPVQQSDTEIALLMNDVLTYTFRHNMFETEGDKMVLDGLLSGLLCCYVDVKDTGQEDEFGRPIRRVELQHVPAREIVIDPRSTKEDYSDARFVHRFKWLSRGHLKKMLRQEDNKSSAEADRIIAKINSHENHLGERDTTFDERHNRSFYGTYKEDDDYLIVHSIVEDDNEKVWSIFWCGNEIVSKKEVTYKEVRFPYVIMKMNTSDKSEYYGVFREIIESQNAINQAVLKLQVMINGQKVFVKEKAVEDIDTFTNDVNRINAVIEVKDLAGIKVENNMTDAQKQYTIIEQAFSRIQKVLGINPSFLGAAFASDSGRKVQLQQHATTLALRYSTSRVEQFYRLLGKATINLVKQFYSAHEVLRLSDEIVGQRWFTLNEPIELLNGEVDEQGIPGTYIPLEQVLDPASNKPLQNEQGNYIVAPVPTSNTEVSFTDADIEIDTAAYNDVAEKSLAYLDQMLAGQMGQVLLQVDLPGYLRASSLAIKSVQTQHSGIISDLFSNAAVKAEQQGAQQQPPGQQPQQPQRSPEVRQLESYDNA